MPSISTGFAATDLHDGVKGPPDLVLCSADDFLFYVHRELLHDASSNAFGGLLGSTVATDPVLRVSEQSTLLCVILHVVYNMAFPTATLEQPTLETIFSAASRMRAFGLVPARLIVQSSTLHSLLLSYAPQHALDVYTFAGNHDIEDLAIPVSEFLLSLDPGSIPDQIADGMNANYLKRLLLLQVSRINDMKEILKPLPAYHVSDSCKFPSSKTWRFAAGSTVLWATPDMSVTSLVSSMKKHANYGDIPCDKCKENFDKNVSKAASRWSQAKATI